MQQIGIVVQNKKAPEFGSLFPECGNEPGHLL